LFPRRGFSPETVSPNCEVEVGYAGTDDL